MGIHKEQWYHYARNFSLVALPLYGVEVDPEEYGAALAAAESCELRDLSYMNDFDWNGGE